MNPSQTLTLPEGATQVPLLWLKQAKPTQPQWWLRTTENTKPFAVIIEAEEFERKEKQLYEWQIDNLSEWLDRVERQWDNLLLREEFVQDWKDKTRRLLRVAPEPVSEFVAGLTMSVKKLDADTLTHEQVATLRYALKIVREGEVEEWEIEKAIDRLFDCQLSPMMSFNDDELFQLYLDEL
ncbi:MAG: hypothetical protein AAF639_18875 [Chloroflexota bacterium]